MGNGWAALKSGDCAAVLLAALGLAGTVPLAGQKGPQALPVGRVITVLGPVDPDSLGFVLMHEHLVSDMLLPDVSTGYRRTGPLPAAFARRFQETGRYFRVPRTPEQQAFWDQPDLTPDMNEHLGKGWLTKSMFVLDDEPTTVAELESYRSKGGGTVVDVTTLGSGARRSDYAVSPSARVSMW